MRLGQNWFQKSFQTKPNLNNVVSRLRKNLTVLKPKAKVEELEEALNQLVLDNTTFKDDTVNQIYAHLPQVLSKMDENNNSNNNIITVNNRFQVSSQESSTAWAEYIRLRNQYAQEASNIDIDRLENAKTQAIAATAKLNTIKGQLFESFLQATLPILNNTADKMTAQVANELTDMLQNTTGPISTQGSQHSSVTYTFNGKTATISSQGKVDVQVKSPLLDGQELFVSAKNYSKLRNISLLSKANVLGLMAAWPNTSDDMINYACQVLTRNKEIDNADNDILDKIFIIQALAGSKSAQDAGANLLITNIASRKQRPISVMYIPDMITELVEESEDFHRNFIIEPENRFQSFAADKEGKIAAENYLQKQLRLSVHLDKEVLKNHYVRQLKKN